MRDRRTYHRLICICAADAPPQPLSPIPSFLSPLFSLLFSSLTRRVGAIAPAHFSRRLRCGPSLKPVPTPPLPLFPLPLSHTPTQWPLISLRTAWPSLRPSPKRRRRSSSGPTWHAPCTRSQTAWLRSGCNSPHSFPQRKRTHTHTHAHKGRGKGKERLGGERKEGEGEEGEEGGGRERREGWVGMERVPQGSVPSHRHAWQLCPHQPPWIAPTHSGRLWCACTSLHAARVLIACW